MVVVMIEEKRNLEKKMIFLEVTVRNEHPRCCYSTFSQPTRRQSNVKGSIRKKEN